MPGPFRLFPRRDETQALGIVRQRHIDDQLTHWSTIHPRTADVWAVLDYWLDRRLSYRASVPVIPGQDGAR